MKIAYAAAIYDPQKLMGAYKRLLYQHAACLEAGISLDFKLFSHVRPKDLPRGIRFHELPGGSKIRRLVAQPFFISRKLSGYEAVILRTLTRTPFYARAFRSPDFALVTEHHALELSEILAGGRYPAYALQRLVSPRCLSRSRAIIGLTREIVEHERAHGFQGSLATVISNGINVDGVKRTGFRPFDGDLLNLAFVGSAAQPWHGLDRLLEGLEAYCGKVKILLHLIGNMAPVVIENPRVSVKAYGVKTGAQLDLLLSGMNLGVSSLALYRNRMNEACVLKTREYTARGLPFIYAYEDPDIPSPANFALRLKNGPGPVDMEKVIEFAGSMDDPGFAQEISWIMRGHAKNFMDWKPKVQAMVDFAKKAAADD